MPQATCWQAAAVNTCTPMHDGGASPLPEPAPPERPSPTRRGGQYRPHAVSLEERGGEGRRENIDASAVAPVLVLACGNPSRGDDALGPSFIEALETRYAEAIAGGTLECCWSYQWQLEQALDLNGRKRVLFVDAAFAADEACACREVQATSPRTPFSHALSADALLGVYQLLHGPAAFSATLLALRAESSVLGEALSHTARQSLACGLAKFDEWFDAGAKRGAGGSPKPR